MAHDRFEIGMQLAWVEDVLREWDPIGCVPADEYDSYAPEILRMLREGTPESHLAAHLESIETNAMALPPRPSVDREFAARLVRGFEQRRDAWR